MRGAGVGRLRAVEKDQWDGDFAKSSAGAGNASAVEVEVEEGEEEEEEEVDGFDEEAYLNPRRSFGGDEAGSTDDDNDPAPAPGWENVGPALFPSVATACLGAFLFGRVGVHCLLLLLLLLPPRPRPPPTSSSSSSSSSSSPCLGFGFGITVNSVRQRGSQSSLTGC